MQKLAISNDAPDFSLLLPLIIDAAEASGRALRKRFRTKLKISNKVNAGVVTNADLEAECAALKILRRGAPDFGILSEESPPQAARSAGRWIVDPLDGSANYARGIPYFSVSIAAEWMGEIVAGVVFHPVAGELYTAIRGKGARVNGERMRVSKIAELGQALAMTGFSSHPERWRKAELRTFNRVAPFVRTTHCCGSAALDLASLARGSTDAFWEFGLQHWDVAAGLLLVQEAGGIVSDFRRRPLTGDATRVVATNGVLHEALLRKINREMLPGLNLKQLDCPRVTQLTPE